MSSAPSASRSDDDRRVTPIGARRTTVEDLHREVERLAEALHHAERRRRTAERTLADVARMAAADAADLRARLAELQPGPSSAPPPPAPADAAAPHRRMPAALRALLVAGAIAGLLLVADGVLTIAWEEPVTAVVQSHAQSALRGQLTTLQRSITAAVPRLQRESAQRHMQREALTLLRAHRPSGSALGSIVIPCIGLRSVFVEATDHAALAKGPGHYHGTVLPGLAGTVGIAGHRTTYGAPFRHIDNLPPGSRIELRMPYGRFVYRVTGTEITTPSDASKLRSQPGAYRLVLTACHPLYSAAKRLVVSARLVSATPA